MAQCVCGVISAGSPPSLMMRVRFGLVLVSGGECCIDRKSENKDNVQWW